MQAHVIWSTTPDGEGEDLLRCDAKIVERGADRGIWYAIVDVESVAKFRRCFLQTRTGHTAKILIGSTSEQR